MVVHITTLLCLILIMSTGSDVVSPHHSLSIAARLSDSSVFHRAASDWTRSRPGPPIHGRTLNRRSRWDATGRYSNLHAQHKQLDSPWQPHLGNQYSARGQKMKVKKGCVPNYCIHYGHLSVSVWNPLTLQPDSGLQTSLWHSTSCSHTFLLSNSPTAFP